MNIIYIYMYIYKNTSQLLNEFVYQHASKKNERPIYSQRTQRDTLWDLQFQGLLFFVQRLSLKNQPWDGWSLQPMWMKDRQTGTSCGGWLVALDSQKLQLQLFVYNNLPPKKAGYFLRKRGNQGRVGPLDSQQVERNKNCHGRKAGPMAMYKILNKDWGKTGISLKQCMHQFFAISD